MQNSALHWSSDHREHHKHVDHHEHDPYPASRGFWYSHIGWMLREYQANRYHDYNNVKDLQNDPIVMWQHRHYLTLTLLTAIGWPLLIGWLLGDTSVSLEQITTWAVTGGRTSGGDGLGVGLNA